MSPLHTLLPVLPVPTKSVSAEVIPKKRGPPSSAQPVVKKLFKGKNKNVDDSLMYMFVLEKLFSTVSMSTITAPTVAAPVMLLLRILHHLLIHQRRRLTDEKAINGMVQKAMEYIDLTPDMETRIELIKPLSYVSAEKTFTRGSFHDDRDKVSSTFSALEF
ncbi:hypothetical protein GUJ93_ZPchr0010g11261 [Zizania palustris]|uniref:Uncharacterized protein n=1 Tax=Zizania palustris TaxID=103762 RepID=A0A8J5WFV0_ZIZPA|nr:hypothetical protein GUJ93_ZPchr0010g11261 [Zizania palustris]